MATKSLLLPTKIMRGGLNLWSSVLLLLLLLLLSFLLDFSQSFHPVRQHVCRTSNLYSSFFHHERNYHFLTTSRSSASSLGASTTKDQDQDDEDQPHDSKTETLVLRGDISVETKELPAMTDEYLIQFMENPKHRNLCVSAGGIRPVEELQLTPELIDEWKIASDKVGSKYPSLSQNNNNNNNNSDQDVVIQVQTGSINFAGLKLVSLSKLGSKFSKGNIELGEYPVYETTLIRDERTVSGLLPLVFIYHKLTGGVDEKKKQTQPPNTSSSSSDDDSSNTKKKKKKSTSVSSVSRITYKRTKENKIIFTATANVTVEVQFPAFLLKILPTNKEKAEQSGGKSISKAVVKDVELSMKALEDAYETFVSSTTTSSTSTTQ